MASKIKAQNTLLYAFFSTFFLALGFVLFFFLWFGDIEFIIKEKTFYISLSIFLLFVLAIFYWFFLKNQRKKDFSEISKNIPQLQSNNHMDFQELSQKISTITNDQSKEIVSLNERENYRRDFLGNISHELKTPLFSVQGYLLTLIEGGINDENIRDKYLNRINKSVDRLIYLVKDLDTIAELENGLINIEFSTFNISALAQDVMDLLEIKAEKNNIKLKLNHPTQQAIKVVGDIQKIQQVLINLLVNAINYSNKNTEVVINFEDFEDRVRISVEDQGVGIRQEELDRIFERFYRIDKSRNRNNGGSGLGLAIVKHILEAHNQKIYVESALGKGSKFSFYLRKK